MAVLDKFGQVVQRLKRGTDSSTYTERIGPEDWHWVTEDKDTRTLAVQPPGRPDACSSFRSLEASIRLGNGLGDGTYDDIQLCLDDRPCTLLASNPDRGFSHTQAIDLVKTFGSEIVPAPGFRKMRLLSVSGAANDAQKTDEWYLKCAPKVPLDIRKKTEADLQ